MPAALTLFGVIISLGARAETVFEDLGTPVITRELGFRFTTSLPGGRHAGWGTRIDGTTIHLVGVVIPSGELIEVDLSSYGLRRPFLFRGPQRPGGIGEKIYVFTGVPGRFLEYDPTTAHLRDLGTPSPSASYWLRGTTGPDGKFYMGTYPLTELARCDPRTGKVENLGRVTEDPAQKYVIQTMVDSNGVAYCLTGYNRFELWALDPASGRRSLLLNRKGSEGDEDDIRLWLAADGRVYGSVADKNGPAVPFLFQCGAERIIKGKTAAEIRDPALHHAGSFIVSGLDAQGGLILRDAATRRETRIPTPYKGAPATIHSLGGEYDGKIYGGCVAPAASFFLDTASGETHDLGVVASSTVQIYDTYPAQKGIFLSSYTPAAIDFFEPKTGATTRLLQIPGQERAKQFAIGCEGRLYIGSGPLKGQLGNSLVRIDPKSLETTVWRNVSFPGDDSLGLQSIHSVVGIAGSSWIACSTSIHGGSSAIPASTEAGVLFWDVHAEKVASVIRPLGAVPAYQALADGGGGVLYGVAGRSYFAYDALKARVLKTGKLPVAGLVSPQLSPQPRGPRGLVYGVGDDALFAIDPATREARIVGRDPVLKTANAFFVSEDDTLYVAVGPRLKRAKIRDLERKISNRLLVAWGASDGNTFPDRRTCYLAGRPVSLRGFVPGKNSVPYKKAVPLSPTSGYRGPRFFGALEATGPEGHLLAARIGAEEETGETRNYLDFTADLAQGEFLRALILLREGDFFSKERGWPGGLRLAGASLARLDRAEIRFVVAGGGAYYASRPFSISMADSEYVLSPSDRAGSWFAFDPSASLEIGTVPAKLPASLPNVEAVGFLLQSERASPGRGRTWMRVTDFSAHESARP